MSTLKKIGGASSSTNNYSTGVLTGWGTGVKALVAVSTAYDAGISHTHTVTGGGVTWSRIGGTAIIDYRARRVLEWFEADGVPSSSALTINTTGNANTFAESMWCAMEIAEYNAAAWISQGPSFDSSGTGVFTVATADLGALSASEMYLIVGACEGGAANLDLPGGTVAHLQQGGTNVRSLLVGSTVEADTTPDITWTDDTVGSAIIGIRVSHGTDGTHAGAGPTITDVDTDESVYQGQTGVTTTGTTFEATQGTGTVILSPTDDINDVNAVAQTVTAWADTSIDFTANFPASVGINGTAYVFVTNDTGDSNASGFAITREAASATVTVTGITGGANLSALEWMVLDGQDLSTATILAQGNGETTDASGDLVLDVLGSGATNGQTVWYIIKDAAETNAAQGPATVAVA